MQASVFIEGVVGCLLQNYSFPNRSHEKTLRIQTYPDHLLLSLPLDTRGYVGLAGWVSESRQGLAALCAKNKQFHQFQGHDSDHIFLALWGKPQTPKVRGTIFTVAYRSYSGNCWAMSFTILESQGAVICRLPGTWFRHVLRMDRESVVEYVEHWWTLMNIDAHWWTCRTIYRLVWLLLDARSNIWCKTHRNHWPKIFLASGGLSPPELCICKTCWVCQLPLATCAFIATPLAASQPAISDHFPLWEIVGIFESNCRML